MANVIQETGAILASVAREWFQHKEVIKKFLKDCDPNTTEEAADHNAAALIARLSHAGFSIVRDSE